MVFDFHPLDFRINDELQVGGKRKESFSII